EMQIEIVAQHLVVIPGDVDDLRALARLAEELLHHVVVQLVPVPRAAQAPAVDDVADEIEEVGLGVLEEIEEEAGLAAARAKMNVGDPDRAIPAIARLAVGKPAALETVGLASRLTHRLCTPSSR